jgi:glycogen operon protein
VFHIILNAYCEPLDFELPKVGDRGEEPLRRWIDTSLDSPHDIAEWHTAEPVLGSTYRAGPRSVVMLFARMKDV